MKARLSVNLNAGEISVPKIVKCKNTEECGQCPNGTGKVLEFPNELVGKTFTITVFHRFYNRTNISTAAMDMSTWNVPPNILFSGRSLYATIPCLDSGSIIGANNSLGHSISFVVPNSRYITFQQANPLKSNIKDTLCVEVKHKAGSIIEVYVRSF